MQAMKERDDEIPLSEYVQIDDAYWGGAEVLEGEEQKAIRSCGIN